MGESGKQGFQLSFNRFLRVGFQGSRVTSNGGLILVRELDERLGFSELIDEHLTDSRANNARFSFADLLRQSVYSRLAGYEDVNDAERLSQDPTFRLIGSEKTWERGAALTSRLQTFETEMLSKVENFVGLARINRELIGKVEAFQWHYRAVLDMDSTEGTVKLSIIRPFCGRILLDQRLRINDLAVAAGGENAAKLLNLTVPRRHRRATRGDHSHDVLFSGRADLIVD